MTGVTVVDHPLVARHLSVLRDRATPSGEFRRRMREAAMLIGYEALRDLRLAEIDVETPLETTRGRAARRRHRRDRDPARRPRAWSRASSRLMPEARVGHLGMYRDEDDHSPVGYYERSPTTARRPRSCSSTRCSRPAAAPPRALRVLKERGAQRLRFVCLVAAPEGVEARAEHPDVPVCCASLDRELDERGYIRPGLGDAGDRVFGTD